MKHFPLLNYTRDIPAKGHPGAFAAIRKYDIHTGIDLYTDDSEPVVAVESGIVVEIEDYTGPKADTPWWNDTKAILIKGETGIICYGEIEPVNINKNDIITAGQTIAFVKPVLPKEKIRKDIPGHSNHMLHFELYTHKIKKSVVWELNEEKPEDLLDPTDLLTSLHKNNS